MPSVLTSFGSDSNWTVPPYVDIIQITAKGGQSSDNSGEGGYAEGELNVTDGETLYVRFPPGGSGASASDSGASASSGAGGDGADVRQGGSSNGNQVIAAGGGGGGGDADIDTFTDTSDSDSTGGADGAGSSDSGDDANDAITQGDSCDSSGGTGGAASTLAGEDGSAESHDYGAAGAGGGGGGGLNGGTAGGSCAKYYNPTDHLEASGAGGGGGDGYTGGVSSSSSSKGTETGSAQIEIEYADRINDLAADSSVEGEVTLTWSEPLDVSSYNIYRAEVTGTDPVDYTEIASGLSTGTTSYTDSSLEDGEQYYYRVENVNSYDNRLSSEKQPITQLPEATNLDGNFDGTDVTLTWTNNDNSSDGGIEIERSTDGGSTWSSIASGLAVSTESYTDTTIQPGETALYRVTRNTDDTSATSVTEEVIVAGSVVIGDASGLRTTNNAVVSTE